MDKKNSENIIPPDLGIPGTSMIRNVKGKTEISRYQRDGGLPWRDVPFEPHELFDLVVVRYNSDQTSICRLQGPVPFTED